MRDYVAADEPSWLKCRVLAFLQTDYFDDVLTRKPKYEGDSVEVVAVAGEAVVGVLDVAVRDRLATIETIAVHPDSARRGIGTQLLAEALRRLPAEVQTIDAWTRENEAANSWYVANGFSETYKYLHVYAGSDAEISSAIAEPRSALTPVAAFFHAKIEIEAALRHDFERVYICRRYERPVQTGSLPGR